MIVSISQPAYLPWLGYFHRIAQSDLHIVLDHVQFERRSFTNRNRVRMSNGSCWLTVPVKTKGRFATLPIESVEIDDDTDWRTKHWKTLYHGYGKTPHFREHAAFFESVYRRPWRFLGDLCRETTGYLLAELGIGTPLLSSSEMSPQGTKTDLLLDLCRKVGATTYLSGPLGRNYIREEIFDRAGIGVVYQGYRHPEYPQCRAKTFEPNLSVVDLLFNCGPRSLPILTSGQVSIQHAELVG